MLSRLSDFLVRFMRDRAGNTAIVIALAALPLVGIVGLGVDYSMMLSVKAKLDHAADAAAIAGIATAQRYILGYTGTGSPTSGAITAGEAQALAQFKANAGALPGGTLQVTAMTVAASGQTLTGNAAYSFAMPTIFMQALGIKTATLTGSSSSSLTMAGYTNIYIVIDVSSSMGIGATTSDQQIVYNATGGCAVACHYTGTTTTARKAGATLRIDVAKQAIITALNTMQASGSQSQFSVAIYTLSDVLTKVFPLTSMSTGMSAAVSAVNSIDISNANKDGGTDTTYTLNALATALPTPGNGLTAATAQGVVMLITDGVQDSDMKYLTGGSYADMSDPNFTVFSPCVSASCEYDTDFQIYIEAFDPSACASLKTKGYKMLTLNVTYLVPPSNLQSSEPQLNAVFSYIQQKLLTSIPTNMASCASSSSNAYLASSPTEIASAVTSMFASVGALARITQ